MTTTPLRARLIDALGALLMLTAASAPHAAEFNPVRRSQALPADADASVIVKFRADSATVRALSVGGGAMRPQQADALGRRLGMTLTDGRVLGPRTQVLKGAGIGSHALAERLAQQGDVEYAVVDGRQQALAAVPNDPLYGPQTSATPPAGQWYLRAPTSATIVDATSVVASINAEAAWGITQGSSSVVVAVLDTGVRFDHPDLTPQLLPGYDFISSASASRDGDTARDNDASDPGDYGCTGAASQNSSWHGTQTSGLIGAATDNGIGMASVGRNVRLLPVRVLGRCGGSDSDIMAAMLWASGIHVDGVPDNTTPARVLNLSFGSSGACNAAYLDIVRQVNGAGTVVVAASGNDGLAVGNPANCTGVVAVGGVRHAGTKVDYSDLGPQVAISAPAGNCVNTTSGSVCLFPILTTSNSGTTTPVAATYTSGGTDRSLGTSFSSPLVAGTAALMISAYPALTPAQVLAGLKLGARPFPSSNSGASVVECAAPTGVAQTECYCTTSTCGAGLLDAGASVAAVAAAHASIAATSPSLAAGTAVTLDGSGSQSIVGVTGFQWAITSGAAFASLSGATNAPTVALSASAPGSVTVGLTVTDAAGRQGTSSVALAVTAPVVAVPSSSGGGGALSSGAAWAGLAACVGVWATRRRVAR